mgnify:CR=1 FL=1
MIKSALAALAALPFAATSALAGPYVNVETNAGYAGNDYTGAVTDLHVGYEADLGSPLLGTSKVALLSSLLTAKRTRLNSLVKLVWVWPSLSVLALTANCLL